MGRDEMTLAQAAAEYRKSATTLRHAVLRGHLKARKFGHLWMVKAPDVGRWIEHGKHQPGPAPSKRS